MLKAREAIIAWNDVNYHPLAATDAPAGSVGIGPLIGEHERDWTFPYACTAGAAETHRRNLDKARQEFHVMMDWYRLVYSYGIDPYIAHRAFLEIEEYVEIIKRHAMGPAKDEPGHDPTVSYGRTVTLDRPNFRVFERGRAVHVWPTPSLIMTSEQTGADRSRPVGNA